MFVSESLCQVRIGRFYNDTLACWNYTVDDVSGYILEELKEQEFGVVKFRIKI